MSTSFLFPEKVGYEKGEPCDFAKNYYCEGCGRCEHEYDNRTEEEYRMDKVAEKISFLTDESYCCDDPDTLADIVVNLISLYLQLDTMMAAHNKGGVCNG